jgi:hypothetical protein
MKQRKWKRSELQWELARRLMFPAFSDTLGYTVPQRVTASDLEAELRATPEADPDRSWREWELALAREHERSQPAGTFVRSVRTPQQSELSAAS